MNNDSFWIIKKINLQKFPLENGGILYFSPEKMGLLESDLLPYRIIEESKKHESVEDVVSCLKSEYSEEYIRDTISALLKLVENGTIGFKTDESVTTPETPPETPPVIRFVISNTSECNLACGYCYNKFKDTAESFMESSTLSFKQLERALEILGDMSEDRTELEILFIGGEPLLRFDLIQAASEMRKTLPGLRNKHVRIFVISNGTLLDEFIYLYCSRNNIHIKLSLDGNEPVHNRYRIFPGGKGSYKTILKKIPEYFTAYRHPCKAVTATVDSYAQDLPALVDHFAAIGFNQVELTELYGINDDPNPGKKQLEYNYSRIADFLGFRVKSRQYISVIPFSDAIYRLHHRRFGHFPCRTGLDSIALFSDGNFYSCHHYMGDSEKKLGNLADGVDLDKFRSIQIDVVNREKCKECWARFLCGGECYHRALVTAGSEHAVGDRGCDRKKELFKQCIYAYYDVKETDPEAWDWYYSINLYP